LKEEPSIDGSSGFQQDQKPPPLTVIRWFVM